MLGARNKAIKQIEKIGFKQDEIEFFRNNMRDSLWVKYHIYYVPFAILWIFLVLICFILIYLFKYEGIDSILDYVVLTTLLIALIRSSTFWWVPINSPARDATRAISWMALNAGARRREDLYRRALADLAQAADPSLSLEDRLIARGRYINDQTPAWRARHGLRRPPLSGWRWLPFWAFLFMVTICVSIWLSIGVRG